MSISFVTFAAQFSDMKLDKNSVIGFVLLALLFFGYFYFTRQGQIELEKKQKQIQDSLSRLAPQKDTTVNIAKLNPFDSAKIPAIVAGQFTQNGSGKEELKIIETELLKITFTNKGVNIFGKRDRKIFFQPILKMVTLVEKVLRCIFGVCV